MLSSLYCKLISLRGESYGAVRLCLSRRKSGCSLPISSPAIPAASGTPRAGADEAEGSDPARPGSPSPSRSLLTPCRHRSPLNHRRGSIGRDKAKSSIDPSCSARAPKSRGQHKTWRGARQKCPGGFLGLLRPRGLRVWAFRRCHLSGRDPESTHSLWGAEGRKGGTWSIPAPLHGMGESWEQLWVPWWLVVALGGVSTSLPGQAPGQFGLSGP